jgi:hypothetical protein
MLNGYQGSINFKEKMLADLNSAYKAGLEDYLNKEVLLQSKNIVYKYNNFTVTFMNIVYDIGLRNNNSFKGLEFKFNFEVENFTKKCNNLPTVYDKQYGGLQEYFGLEFMRAAAWYAASNNFFNRKVTNTWDTEVFQFYAGDLSNAVNRAKEFPPNTAIVADCFWNNSSYNINILVANSSGIIVDLPLTCQLTANQSGKTISILSVNFGASFAIRIVLMK